MILLSPHFTLHELIKSDTAVRKGIDNNPDPIVLENLKLLASKLEVVRAILGRPVRISSGYRSKALNEAIGGSKTSTHMSGLAADFEAPDYGPIQKVFDRLRMEKDELGYDQLILEFPPDGWEGELDGKLKVARKLKALGIALDVIVQSTGLGEKEIAELREEQAEGN